MLRRRRLPARAHRRARTVARGRTRQGTGAPPHRTVWQPGACAAAVAGVALMVTGCGAAPRTGPVIQLSSAQVTEPSANGTTEAYVDVVNNGPADKIVSASLSVGGRVMLRSPDHPGVVVMRTVPSIAIPAQSSVGLDPNGSHLLIIGAGRMKAGTEITLTLVFAHAGSISVPALVTNPQTGGSSYFLN
ncbi:MAG: copper chaperone PCu(A)C [Streptosporangiaceae bacterium]